jgi:uncharacterized protein
MLAEDLHVGHERLSEVCERYGVGRLEVFGSRLRGEAGAQSDLDILVTFRPGAARGLEFVAVQQELEGLLGRPVDLLSRKSVEHSPNKYFGRFAVSQTGPIYESS